MKCAVIGAGRFGKNHVRTLHEMGLLAAVAELNDGVREACAKDYGVPVFADYREMLATDVPAVAVATPASTHYAIAKDAILAGKHVLVEKPMTLDVAEGEELVALAQEKGVTLMVGHLLIYQPAIQYLRSAIREGKIGKVVSLHQERLNLGKARDTENALWSLGVHDVAVALYLLGEAPTSLVMSGLAALNPGVEDDTYVHMAFSSGAKAHIHSSWLWPVLRRHLVIVGTDGMLVFDEPSKQVVLHRKRIDGQLNNVDEGSEVVFEGDGQPLRLELQHFLDCAASGNAPNSDGQSGVDVLRVLASAS